MSYVLPDPGEPETWVTTNLGRFSGFVDQWIAVAAPGWDQQASFDDPVVDSDEHFDALADRIEDRGLIEGVVFAFIRDEEEWDDIGDGRESTSA